MGSSLESNDLVFFMVLALSSQLIERERESSVSIVDSSSCRPRPEKMVTSYDMDRNHEKSNEKIRRRIEQYKTHFCVHY